MRKAWTVLTPAGLVLIVLSALTLQGGDTSASGSGGTGLKAVAQEGRIVRPRHGAFEVEVIVEGYPREALYGRGRRYVEASEGAEYELRIRNPLPVRVAVALSVDGLNTIDARRSSSWDSSKWLIEPYQTIRVSGWQMSSSRARRFYFTTERDSYAAKLGRPSDLGVINAVFYRENMPRPRPVVPPIYRGEEGGPAQPRPMERRGEDGSAAQADRAESAKSRSRPSVAPPAPDDEHAATGIGRSVDHQVSFVNLDLERRPVAEVSIRYEYRDALFKLGVLPRPQPREDALRRRERARGFEDPRFSPEP
jgi:hypothetical protein